MKKDALLKQITILDFIAVDLHLFLNTHPCDTEALGMYNDVVTTAQKVRKQYEECCGPLTAFRSEGTADWTWENCPWPWQESFNLKLSDYGDSCMKSKPCAYANGEER